MSDLRLIEAVKAEDVAGVRELLAAGADVHQQDEHLWTPLNWAAGKGNMELVSLLVEHGADVAKVGRDERTPYQIALAAGHAEVARYLRQVETGDPEAQRPLRQYCKAYLLADLRRYPGWPASHAHGSNGHNGNGAQPPAAADEEIAFLHQDYTVTQSMQHDEDVLFAEVTPEWQAFCADELKFRVPDDLDLVVPHAGEEAAAAGEFDAVAPGGNGNGAGAA